MRLEDLQVLRLENLAAQDVLDSHIEDTALDNMGRLLLLARHSKVLLACQTMILDMD